MLTITSEYALRAMIYIAQREAKCPIPGRAVAEETGIPPKYLSKILGDLVRGGVLESSPGKSGGFRLRRPATEVALSEVLAPFDSSEGRRCPFGEGLCDDSSPCLAHHRWKQVVDTQLQFLHETTLYDVAIGEERR